MEFGPIDTSTAGKKLPDCTKAELVRLAEYHDRRHLGAVLRRDLYQALAEYLEEHETVGRALVGANADEIQSIIERLEQLRTIRS